MKHTVDRLKLVESEVLPRSTRLLDDGNLFIDFGKAVFGTVIVPVPADSKRSSVVIHLGEKLNAERRIDRTPPGTIRYIRIEQELACGQATCRISIPPDQRNTGQAAIKMPDYIGEVYPFRYVEIEDAADIEMSSVRQVFVHCPFDDSASSFESSDDVLNAVWDLCKYSIKATTFCGVYVDGDRERIPYEGDAYINQLGHYCVDHEYNFARYSHEYMIQKPTWCTEWHLHSVMIAWADYMYTGQTSSLAAFYDELCAKTLIDFARADGLISVAPGLRTPEMSTRLESLFESGVLRRDIRDVVDWPPGSFTDGGTGERDNHEMLPINTVVNAFHCHAVTLMSRIANAVGRADDALRFARQASIVNAAINRLLFDPERGLYVDGEGSKHSSLHSNMFMLAFDLVPESRREAVVSFVKSRGMACSVYGAQHLLEALYLNGEGSYALELMTATHDRGWWNMLEAGSTITLEAWDIKYKKNLDWNHAWGAAPANIVGRYLLGVRPLEPGFSSVLIQPQPGLLKHAAGVMPSIRGPVSVSFRNEPDQPFELRVDIPEKMTARVGVPHRNTQSRTLILDGVRFQAEADGGYLVLDGITSGRHMIEGE